MDEEKQEHTDVSLLAYAGIVLTFISLVLLPHAYITLIPALICGHVGLHRFRKAKEKARPYGNNHVQLE